MKKSFLISNLVCLLLFFAVAPSFAQYQNNGSSLSQAGSPMFTAPNYWGDSRVKNRSTATNQNAFPQQATPFSGGRSRGGSTSPALGLIGPAMMLPAMVVGGGMGRMMGPRDPRRKKQDDEEKRNRKKQKKASKRLSVNEESSLPDPLYPMQGMSGVSRKTLDLQAGNGQPPLPIEQQSMSVSGVVENKEPGVDF